MKKQSTLIIAIIATSIILSITSCTKTGPAGPTGPSGPTLTGSITGFVTTYDQYGFKVAADQSGVMLILDNPLDTAYTDASGKYTFNNIQTGTYSYTISRAGYSTTRVQDLGCAGGGATLRNVGINRPPYFGLVAVNDTIENTIANGPGILVRGTDTADTSPRTFIIFANSASTVSSTPANFIYYNSGTIKAGATSFALYITSRELNDAGIASGSTVYLAVYPVSTGLISYTDLATGRAFITSVGTTPTALSAIVP